jgi:PhnB protein
MKLYSQLNFGGNCEEAFLFCEKNLGGKMTAMMRPDQLPSQYNVPPGMEKAIVHARMNVAGVELIGNDVPPIYFQPIRSSYLNLTLDSTESADRTWNVLADGGEITMPIAETFFRDAFWAASRQVRCAVVDHSPEADVKEAGWVDDWYAALGRGAVTGLAAVYADDVVVAGLAPTLWMRGRHKYIENMAGWFGTFDEPLKGGPEHLSIVAADSVAFVNGIGHIFGKKKDGFMMDMRMRLTLCFEKRDRKWLVVTEHASVPFDMQSYKPLIDLKS